MSIGEKIKSYRNKAKLTQKDLAEKSGISLRALSNYESEIRDPSMEVIIKISDALGVDPLDIVDKEVKDMRQLIDKFAKKMAEDAFNAIYETVPSWTKAGFEEKFKEPHEFWEEVVFSYPSKFFDLSDLNLNDKEFDDAVDEMADFLENAYKLKVEEISKRKNK